MGERKSISIDDLIIWTDNPRLGFKNENIFSEEDAINILTEVVGVDKMYNLLEDIFKRKGLIGNVLPTVVLNDGRYIVYDGNRRISSLKMIREPSVIEDEKLKGKVTNLLKNKDVFFTNTVFVYIADDENEAFDLMDNLHLGEQDGIGLMRWDAYNRDIALKRRNKKLHYPHAFEIVQTLSSLASDPLETIPYTDLDRIFAYKKIHEYISLPNNAKDPEKVEYIIGMLNRYKAEIGFESFSRQFNKTDALDSFCLWINEQKNKEKDFYFSSTPVSIFIDEIFSLDLINLKIFDSQKNNIPFAFEELKITYETPNKIITDSLDIIETGEWRIYFDYKGQKHSEVIKVKELLSPSISFDSNMLFGVGDTINLKDLVLKATDGHGKSRKADLKISSKDGTIFKNVFTAENGIGKYKISYEFKDVTGVSFVRTKEIQLTEINNPLLPENLDVPLLSFDGESTHINISEVVNRLVLEINTLTQEGKFADNICIISTSLRALIELSFDELRSKEIINFSNNKLEDNIKEFKTFLMGKELQVLQAKNPSVLKKYTHEKNRLDQIDVSDFASYLHLAAHQSIAAIEVTKMSQIAKKYISPILVYTSLLLKEKEKAVS